MGNINIYLLYLIALVITLIIFLLLREVVCWYYKINESISLQIKLNELLERLVLNENSDQEISFVTIDNLQVATMDCVFAKNWFDANKYCQELGVGWRLPTKNELEILYKNKDSIKGFSNSGYWSFTEDNSDFAWGQGFSDGKQAIVKKEVCLNIRPVKEKK
jgi:hypothetical protein